MSRRLPKSAQVYVGREVITSDAFLSLSGKSPQVLLIFFTKRQVQKLKRPGPRGERFRVVNNGELVFTYREAEKRHGLSSKVFCHAIDELVRVGFLDITKHGGGLEGDCTRYALSERWRDYGTSAFQPAERPKGRPWTTRATSPKGRASASPKGRASAVTASLKGRASPPESPPPRGLQGTHSIDHQCVSSAVTGKGGGEKAVTLDRRTAAVVVKGGRAVVEARDLGEVLRLSLGRAPTPREQSSFNQAVTEAQRAGATDALIAHFVRQTPLSEGVWTGPNAAREAARKLVRDWTVAGLEPRRDTVQAILDDLAFVQRYESGQEGPTENAGLDRCLQVQEWAARHADTLAKAREWP